MVDSCRFREMIPKWEFTYSLTRSLSCGLAYQTPESRALNIPSGLHPRGLWINLAGTIPTNSFTSSLNVHCCVQAPTFMAFPQDSKKEPSLLSIIQYAVCDADRFIYCARYFETSMSGGEWWWVGVSVGWEWTNALLCKATSQWGSLI